MLLCSVLLRQSQLLMPSLVITTFSASKYDDLLSLSQRAYFSFSLSSSFYISFSSYPLLLFSLTSLFLSLPLSTLLFFSLSALHFIQFLSPLNFISLSSISFHSSPCLPIYFRAVCIFPFLSLRHDSFSTLLSIPLCNS